MKHLWIFLLIKIDQKFITSFHEIQEKLQATELIEMDKTLDRFDFFKNFLVLFSKTTTIHQGKLIDFCFPTNLEFFYPNISLVSNLTNKPQCNLSPKQTLKLLSIALLQASFLAFASFVYIIHA
jgi:hypothetical protein